MRICSCWGFTAPMLVLTFPKLDEARELIGILSRNSDQEEITNFQQEMTALEKVARFADYKVTLNLEDFAGDQWENGGLCNIPTNSEAFKVFLQQSVLQKLFYYEKEERFLDLSDLDSILNSELAVWSGPVEDYRLFVNGVIRRVREKRTSSAMAAKWMKSNMAEGDWLYQSVTESAMVNGKVVELDERARKTIGYFIRRLPEISEMCEFLKTAKYEEKEVMGVPLAYLLKRKPESIYYTVCNEFEKVKNVSNASILNNVVAAVKRDIDVLRRAYTEYVTDGTTEARVELSVAELPEEEQELFGELQQYGYSMMHLSSDERSCLADVGHRIDQMDVEKLLGIRVGDLDRFGEEMCAFGIYGINGKQAQLFKEAIMNTVISVDKVFRSREDIEAVELIITRDVEPLLDTIRPVGVSLV